MTSKLIAIVEDLRQSTEVDVQQRAVASTPPWQLEKKTELDPLLTGISWVVAEAQSLSRENKKRLAQFLFAAGEMVSERTRLDPEDQKTFEAHLRAVRNR